MTDKRARDTAPSGSMPTTTAPPAGLTSRHLLGIEGRKRLEITGLIDRGNVFADIIQGNGQNDGQNSGRFDPPLSEVLRGRTVLNLFFENSTRTRVSFELAAKNLGGSVLNINVAGSSVKKGETLLDTATTLNAMHPDLLVVRHQNSGAVGLLAQKVNCSVINAGDGRHEHPTQALLDALTIRRHKGRLHRLTVAICGDINHSRVARSNIMLLNKMENRVRVIAPPTLLPNGIERMGVEVFDDMRKGLEGVDVVMMRSLSSSHSPSSVCSTSVMRRPGMWPPLTRTPFAPRFNRTSAARRERSTVRE